MSGDMRPLRTRAAAGDPAAQAALEGGGYRWRQEPPVKHATIAAAAVVMGLPPDGAVAVQVESGDVVDLQATPILDLIRLCVSTEALVSLRLAVERAGHHASNGTRRKWARALEARLGALRAEALVRA